MSRALERSERSAYRLTSPAGYNVCRSAATYINFKPARPLRKTTIYTPSGFRVKAPVTRRPPHRSVREAFPHTVPRFRPFLPSRQPIRRHPDWRITLLPCNYSNIMDYSGARQGEGLENLSKLLVIYIPIPAAFTKPTPQCLLSVFIHHLQHLIVAPHPKILVKPSKLAA